MAFFEDGPAMSHNDDESYGWILRKVLPYLTLHESYWYRDRHYHGRLRTPNETCACCRTNSKWRSAQNVCGLCMDAWSLSKVNTKFKQHVCEYGRTFNMWWREFTPEERKQKALERRNKGKGKHKPYIKGKGKGYQPQTAYNHARGPQPTITNDDRWPLWDSPEQEWVPRPPSTPPLPPRGEALIAELVEISERPLTPPSMWTNAPPPPPPLPDLEDQPETRSCREDGRYEELTSRLADLAVRHVPAEVEKSCQEEEHDLQKQSAESGPKEEHDLQKKENGPEEEHAFAVRPFLSVSSQLEVLLPFGISGPKEEHDLDAMD